MERLFSTNRCNRENKIYEILGKEIKDKKVNKRLAEYFSTALKMFPSSLQSHLVLYLLCEYEHYSTDTEIIHQETRNYYY